MRTLISSSRRIFSYLQGLVQTELQRRIIDFKPNSLYTCPNWSVEKTWSSCGHSSSGGFGSATFLILFVLWSNVGTVATLSSLLPADRMLLI